MDLNEAEVEVEATLARLVRERAAVEQWAEADDAAAVEDDWALANAREAIREELGSPRGGSLARAGRRTVPRAGLRGRWSYRSELNSLLRRIDEYLARWAMRKYKRLRRRPTRTWRFLTALATREPTMFAHWTLTRLTAG